MTDYMAWNADRSRGQLSSYLLLEKNVRQSFLHVENGDRYWVIFPAIYYLRKKYLMRLDFPLTETFLLNSNRPWLAETCVELKQKGNFSTTINDNFIDFSALFNPHVGKVNNNNQNPYRQRKTKKDIKSIEGVGAIFHRHKKTTRN